MSLFNIFGNLLNKSKITNNKPKITNKKAVLIFTFAEN